MIPFKVGVFVIGKDFCGREYIESAFRVFVPEKEERASHPWIRKQVI